jgi:hypothetical protein
MDTEAQIAADLAAALPKPVIPENGWDGVKPEVPEDEQFLNKQSPESSLEKIKLFDYFELSQLDRHAPEAEKYLQRIIDWAKDEAKSSDYADILRVINDQERVMGNKLKSNRLSNLHRFVAIRATRNRLIQEERALYNA